jgi:hypothetical protein
MDCSLIAEELDWMRRLRDSTGVARSALCLPPQVAFRLRMRGYVLANAHGSYAITQRGRGELLERGG